MRFPRFFHRLTLFVITITLPLSSSAASVASVLQVQDDEVMSRGDFIRASVAVLNIPLEHSFSSAKYSRPVPKNLQSYVGAADKKDALAVFGKDLGLSLGITRGEAAIVLMKLQNAKPATTTGLAFTDVKGTDLENAVRLSIEKKWMKPVRSTLFGTERMLTGREAKSVLRAVTGEKEPETQMKKKEPTIPAGSIKIKSGKAVQLPQNELLRTIWQLLKDEYLYGEKLDEKNASYSAAEALVNSLNDSYTTFFRPADAASFQQQLSGEISGIGAQVEYKDNALTVIAPLSGSPAEKAGVKPGDRIIKVDGASISGLDLNRSVEKIRGPKGTEVTLTIQRNGNEFEIKVTRDKIVLPEIDISFQSGIAVVKLVQFGKTTDTKLRDLMKDVQKQEPKGIVLDLRNNPGGLLHAASIVISNFVPEGSGVATIKSKDGEYTEVTTDAPTIDAKTPVVVLVNKGSASASEIVAGALQDHNRAKVLGEKTFGKGTVQQVLEFRDGSSLKMTIAEWYTPKGRAINGNGVEPDVTVTQTEGRDDVLLRALDLLR